jgi:hypothetical protein
MKLSREEEVFLRRWMYFEMRYQEGIGPAKRLQLQHQAVPADLATLIAAAIPDPAEQEAAGLGPPPPEPPVWPWSGAGAGLESLCNPPRAWIIQEQPVRREEA